MFLLLKISSRKYTRCVKNTKCAVSDADQSIRCWEKVHQEENGSEFTKPYIIILTVIVISDDDWHTYGYNHHHHHQEQDPSWSITASTVRRRCSRSCARLHAMCRPILSPLVLFSMLVIVYCLFVVCLESWVQ